MRSLGTRRAALVAGAATVAALVMGGCSAGQVAETAILDAPIAGVNAQSADGSVLVRNLQVEYNGTEGYHANESAPLEVGLYNQTNETVTVTISPSAPERPQVVTGTQVGLVSSATVTTPGQAASTPAEAASTPAEGELADDISTGASAEPAASTAPPTSVQRAQVEIGPQGSALFRPTDAAQLQIVGLTGDLKPGMSVNLVFEFSNGAAPLTLQAPVATPLSPAPRPSGEAPEKHLGEAGHE